MVKSIAQALKEIDELEAAETQNTGDVMEMVREKTPNSIEDVLSVIRTVDEVAIAEAEIENTENFVEVTETVEVAENSVENDPTSFDSTNNSGETKNEKFRRLINARANMVIEALRKISNLSNKYTYEWEMDEVEHIFDHIRGEMNRTEKLFDRK